MTLSWAIVLSMVFFLNFNIICLSLRYYVLLAHKFISAPINTQNKHQKQDKKWK